MKASCFQVYDQWSLPFLQAEQGVFVFGVVLELLLHQHHLLHQHLHLAEIFQNLQKFSEKVDTEGGYRYATREVDFGTDRELPGLVRGNCDPSRFYTDGAIFQK